MGNSKTKKVFLQRMQDGNVLVTEQISSKLYVNSRRLSMWEARQEFSAKGSYKLIHKITGINLSAFNDKFLSEYSFCYENYDRVAGFSEAFHAFDNEMNASGNDVFRWFVQDFCDFRGDYITSDREAAAFMFAYSALPEI